MGNTSTSQGNVINAEDLDPQKELDHEENANRTLWDPPIDHLIHRKRTPIDDPDISIQNCSNLGINVGSQGSPYNLCMCTIATHGEFENTPLEPESDKEMFVVPRNTSVFVFSAAAPGCVSKGKNDAGPHPGRTMRDLFPNVYTPIDPNVPPITIADARDRIKQADEDHIMNTKISAIRDTALNFTYMDPEKIKTNMMRLSDALKTEDRKTIYLPLEKEYEEKKINPNYKFTDEDIFDRDYLDAFLTPQSYSVKQYNPGESMYIKTYTVNNTDRQAITEYSYDWNIFELFSGCNLTKFLSRNSRTGRHYVTNKTIIEHCATTAASKGILCVIILFDLSCSVFTYKGYDATLEDTAILKANLTGETHKFTGEIETGEIETGEMDAGGARKKRKHITHRKKNIKNRKINIKHKKRVTKKNKIFRRVY